jgi:hypothetical protein
MAAIEEEVVIAGTPVAAAKWGSIIDRHEASPGLIERSIYSS